MTRGKLLRKIRRLQAIHSQRHRASVVCSYRGSKQMNETKSSFIRSKFIERKGLRQLHIFVQASLLWFNTGHR